MSEQSEVVVLSDSRFRSTGIWHRIAVILMGAAGCFPVPLERAGGAVVVEEDESVIPHLRLDLPGHTGEVRALAFAADSSRLFSGGRDKLVMEWAFAEEAPADGDGGRRSRRIVLQQRRLRNVFRWQVGRATRGAVQAIAATPGNGRRLVAIAGSGFFSQTGEILVVDAVTGEFVRMLGAGVDAQGNPTTGGHRQAVTALDFTTDGSWLVSADLDGQVLAWRRAEWEGEGDVKPLELAPRDDQIYPQNVRDLIKQSAAVRRLAVAVGADRAAFAVFSKAAGAGDQSIPIWKIRVASLEAEGAKSLDLPGDYIGSLTALDATDDGRYLAAGDLQGTVRRVAIDPGAEERSSDFKLAAEAKAGQRVAESLAFWPQGDSLAVGVSRNRTSPPAVQVYRVPSWQRVTERVVSNPIYDLRVSPDGNWLAWTGGRRNAVMVEKMPGGKPADGGEGKPVMLGGVGRSITRLAFLNAAGERAAAALEQAEVEGQKARRVVLQGLAGAPAGEAAEAAAKRAPRRIGMTTKGWQGGEPPPIDSAFDLERLAVSSAGEAGWWAPPAGVPAGWTLRQERLVSGKAQRWRLEVAGKKAGFVDLDPDMEGAVTCPVPVWITTAGADRPWAVALGTERGISLYAIESDAEKQCRLVRRCRGHDDDVQAIAVSEDGAWLASGGRDGLIMFWSLSRLDADDARFARWGIAAEVRDGKVVVTAVDGAGPLAGKDVRVGDVITKIVPSDAVKDAVRELVDPAAILAELAAVDWNTQVAFFNARGGAALKEFYRYPAWENVVALLLTDDREWAYWSPRGYHAASANGNTFFGWLVNRGFDRLPRFYRAAQFRRRLERPDVMARILAEGSLDAALQAAGRGVPQSSAAVLPEQIAAAPSVRIISPRPDTAAEGRALEVTAEVETGDGTEIERLRAYASGATSAAEPRLVEDRPAGDGKPRTRVYSWRLDLPAEDRQRVQVFAATREGPTDAADVVVQAAAGDAVPRRLFVLGGGIDDFSGIVVPAGIASEKVVPNLGAAVRDATSLHERFTAEGRGAGLFSLGGSALLTNSDMKRQAWRASLQAIVEGNIGPDDLLVVILAGHGLNESFPGAEEGETRFSFVCADSEFTIDEARRSLVISPDSAITWDDFDVIADLPCRKIALVDACHSGALIDGRRGDTIREFQENMVLVVAAAEGKEESQEIEEWGHGVFTKAFLDALDGLADAPEGSAPTDGEISLDEAIDYVVNEVPRLALTVDKQQHPTVSPSALLPYVNIPLARVRSAKPSPPATGR